MNVTWPEQTEAEWRDAKNVEGEAVARCEQQLQAKDSEMEWRLQTQREEMEARLRAKDGELELLRHAHRDMAENYNQLLEQSKVQQLLSRPVYS